MPIFAAVIIQKKDIMAKKKKVIKAKEPIRLRSKQLANGNKSLYLDTYKDGKRAYEFLKLYLIPETDEAAKARNKATLQAANAIKSQKIIELTNDEAGITKTSSRSKMLLIDWMRHYSDHKLKTGQSAAFHIQIDKAIRHLIMYKGDGVMMKDVNKSFCLGFIDYLNNAKRMDNGKPLAKATTAGYFTCLNCALNAAVKEDIIAMNPITKINSDDRIKIPESTREYLTVEEIKAMIASKCVNEPTKQAYLFSCFCGLRLSDIQALTWGDIILDGTQYRARIVMRKTQKALYLPLSDEALRWMPKRGEAKDTDKVFHLPSRTYIGVALKAWALAAGITKTVSFHSSRHSFATLMLTLGVDLYTTSKLLGHTQVKTTEVYGRVVDKKKDEAVNLVNDIFK